MSATKSAFLQARPSKSKVFSPNQTITDHCLCIGSIAAPTIVTKQVQLNRRPRTGGPPKIRAPIPQQITHTMSGSPTVTQIRLPSHLVTASQPQVIPISSLGSTQVVSTSMAKGLAKAKVVKKGLNVSTTSVQNIPTSDSSTLKVIYTSQGQQIVFSPSKQTAQLNSSPTVVSLQPSTSLAPPGKVLLRPVGPKTINSSQPQQVIILSPVKANTSCVSASVTAIAPANKVLPMKAQPVIAAKSPQRVLAPAPSQSKIAISKALTDTKPVQLIRVVPLSSVQTPQQVSSAATFSSSKLVPLRPIAPNTTVRAIAPIPQSTQKIIVPTTGPKSALSSLSAPVTTTSTTFLTTTGPSSSGQVFMLQNSSLLKLTPTTTSSASHPSKSVSFASTSSQRTNFVPIAPSPMTTASSNPTLTAAQLSSLKITNG